MYNAVEVGISGAVCASMEESIGTEMRLKAKERAKELISPLQFSAMIERGWYASDIDKMAKQLRENTMPHKSGIGEKMSVSQLNSIGVQYEKGDRIDKNLAAAAEYYRQAADRSYPLAQYNLARLYQDGKGVSKSSKTAFSLFYKAASTGHVSSQNQLAVAYALGNGVPKNLVRAYMWFNIAAGNGSKTAANNRELAAQQMTPYQIQEAQRLSSEWTPQPQATP